MTAVNYSSTFVANMALDELPWANIASINETTPAGNACRRWYAQAFAELLERADWSFTRVRASLTLRDTNDREGDWLFAYALPSDFAIPIRLLPPPSGSVTDVVELLTGQSLAYPSLTYNDPGLMYDLMGATIYANTENAVLEYVGDVASFNNASALFVKALALDLACKVCVPLTKDRKLKLSLMQEAQVAQDRAISQNANARPQTYGGNFVSEAEMARAGVDISMIGRNGIGGQFR
jgi:hypothetical protein